MSNYTSKFISFAIAEMQVRPSVIRQWAEQDGDKELKELARAVIEAAEQVQGVQKK